MLDIIGFNKIDKYTFVDIISRNLIFALFYLFDLTSECYD